MDDSLDHCLRLICDRGTCYDLLLCHRAKVQPGKPRQRPKPGLNDRPACELAQGSGRRFRFLLTCLRPVHSALFSQDLPLDQLRYLEPAS